MGLTTGLGATCFGYFVQGWFKFGGVEYFKIQAVQSMGEEKAWANKSAIYIGAAACAEFIADIFLCPLEAVRIRQVSDPDFRTRSLRVSLRCSRRKVLVVFTKVSHLSWPNKSLTLALNLLYKELLLMPCTCRWGSRRLNCPEQPTLVFLC